jgi:hypothetical protein
VPFPGAIAKERNYNLLGRTVGTPAKRNSLCTVSPQALLDNVDAPVRDSEGSVPTELELEEPKLARGRLAAKLSGSSPLI